ncbi:hypothetical protein V8F33_005898 [Rhypophila sp. PSN 637]
MADQDYYKSTEDGQQRQQCQSSFPTRNSYYPVYPEPHNPGFPYGQNIAGYSPYQSPSPAGSARGFNLPQNPPPQGQIPHSQFNHADTSNIHPAYYSSPSPPAQGYSSPHTWQSQQPLQWHQQQQHLQPCQSSYSPSPSPSHQSSSPALCPSEYATHSNDSDQPGSPQTDPQSEQDRGLLATLSGGAGGAFIGSKVKVGNGQHNTMAKIAGAVAGAVIANVIEDKLKNQKHATGPSFYSQSQQAGQQQQTHGSTGGNASGLAGVFDEMGGLLAGESDGAGNTKPEFNPQSPGHAQAQGQSSYGPGGQDQSSYGYGFQGQGHHGHGHSHSSGGW